MRTYVHLYIRIYIHTYCTYCTYCAYSTYCTYGTYSTYCTYCTICSYCTYYKIHTVHTIPYDLYILYHTLRAHRVPAAPPCNCGPAAYSGPAGFACSFRTPSAFLLFCLRRQLFLRHDCWSQNLTIFDNNMTDIWQSVLILYAK